MFESGVNPEGIQTDTDGIPMYYEFESGVNPEGIQTHMVYMDSFRRLRVV